MGPGGGSLQCHSSGQDLATIEINARQGFFAEALDNKVRRTFQVWLRYKVDGTAIWEHCGWEEPYNVMANLPNNKAQVRGRAEAMLLLLRQIAHSLNTGVPVDLLRQAVRVLELTDIPVLKLPEPWFYWASRFDEDPGDETNFICTHYFVNSASAHCLVWQEDTYVEVVPCEDVDIAWDEIGGVIDAEYGELSDV